MKKTILLVGVIWIILLLLFFPYKDSLVFEAGNTGDIEVYYPTQNLQSFKILYTHSIHLSDVIEIYKIIPKDLIMQTELIYEDYAIGMPSGPSEGEKFTIENGKMHITNMTRKFPYLDIRIGQVVSNHRLIIDGVTYELGNYVSPGSWVRVKMRKISNVEVWKGVKLHEP
ncbi:DUF1850 domain-containing protein [Bacillus pinisoli]|uniref:DUF1850 domain-containing protein n=1 Tax=Bacillus pinisoli TaxID=2901866 RepID=UPI001FF546A6|nr:DUF1850 domain-containing protein [Bacillus pinisoli]